MNQEIRQQALRGLYLPVPDEAYCMMGPDGRLTDGYVATCSIKEYESQRAKGYRFFPDEQTRTEYLQVGEGTWLPKKGDGFHILLPNGVVDSGVRVAQCNFVTDEDGWIYFPSEQQALAFIAKRKGEEPKEGVKPIHGTSTVKEFTDALRESFSTKPQTITICISDEAMIKVTDRINLLVQEDWTPKYSRSVVEAVVSGLHLEATLIGGAQ